VELTKVRSMGRLVREMGTVSTLATMGGPMRDNGCRIDDTDMAMRFTRRAIFIEVSS
jgi:hypothetical protein